MKKPSRKESAKEVWRLFTHRERVPQYIKRWALAEVSKVAIGLPASRVREEKVWCSNCGQEFEKPAKGSTTLCPHCGAAVLNYKERGYTSHTTEYNYLRQVTTYGDWQVIKEYTARQICRKGKPFEVEVIFVYAIFLNPATRSCFLITRPLCFAPYWSKCSFSLYSKPYLRKRSVLNTTWFSGWRDATYPKVELLEEFRRRGVPSIDSMDLEGGVENYLWASTKGGPILETLQKTGQSYLAKTFIQNERYQSLIIRFWRSYILALRHGLKVGHDYELRDFFDYCADLRYMGYDTRNPKYIAPTNLREAHSELSDKVQKKKQRAYEKAQAALQRRQDEEAKKTLLRDKRARTAYKRRITRYLGLVIMGNNLSIAPLKSVEEFIEEGSAMHHCVFSNKYWARPESLIMSARDGDGQRLETVEVDLKEFRIVQSRSVCNGTSPRHQDIIDLVNANMPVIQSLTRHAKA